MNRIRLNARTDVIMGLLLLATAFSWRNRWAHIALGIGLVVIVLVHLWLHRRWVAVHIRRFAMHRDKPPSPRARLNLMVDLYLAAFLLLSTISGLALVLSHSFLWMGLHSTSSWALFLGSVVHVLSHVRWIVRNVRVNPLASA